MAQPQFAVAPASPYSWPRRNLRWFVAGLLCVVTIINYVDRQTLSVVAPVLSRPPHQGGFGMTASEYSYITMTFLVFYVVGQALGGIIMDKLGTRIGFAVILVWWSLATICHRFANSVLSFAFWRAMLGLGEAGNWPGAIKTISEWFPVKERGLATGIFNFGSSTGALVAPPLVVGIIAVAGWRNAFVLAGTMGFLWLVAWLWFFRLPRQHPLMTPGELTHIESGQESTANHERAERLPWFSLLKYRQVWGMLIPRFLSEPVWWFYVFWLPKYLVEKRGFSLGEMALAASVPFLTADLGCLAGGGISSLLIQQGWSVNRARKTVMVASAFLMPAALFVTKVQSGPAAIALISLATFAHQSWSTTMLTLPADLFPQRVVASVTGLGGLGISASILGQFLVGYAVSHASYAPVFTAAGLLHPTAAIVMLLLVGRIHQVRMEG